MTALPPDLFAQAVRLGPLVSIDLITLNRFDQVLLGLRSNRPAQNTWFVPGGRVHKDERLADAIQRISQAELGRTFGMDQALFKGVYEHLYPDNFSGDPGFGTHYMVLAYTLPFDAQLDRLPAAQHGTFRWFGIDELLEHLQVHENTKTYFR